MTGRFSLPALHLISAAAPAWIYLTWLVAQTPTFVRSGYCVVPLFLFVATVAIFRMTNRSWSGLGFAALLAVLLLFSGLILAFI